MLEVILAASLAAPEDYGWVRGLDCDYVPGAHASMAHCTAELADEAELWRVLGAFHHGLDMAWAHDVSEVRYYVLEWLAQYMFADILVDLDGALGQTEATSRAHFAHQTGGLDYLGHRAGSLFDIEDKELARWARRWFARDRAVVMVVTPQHAAQLDPPNVLPSPDTAPQLPPLDARRASRTLDNGLEGVVVPPEHAPLSEARVVFPAGRQWEPAPGAHLGVHTCTKWRVSMSLDWLTREMAGHFSSSYGERSTWLRARGASGNLADQVQLLRHVISYTRIETEGRQNAVDESIVDLFAFGYTEPAIWAGPFSYARLFAGHPLGRPWWQQAKDARQVADRVIYRWHRNFYRPGGAALILAGRVDEEGAMEAAERWFGRWGARKGEPPGQPPPLPPPPERTLGFIPAEVAPSQVGGARCRPGGQPGHARPRHLHPLGLARGGPRRHGAQHGGGRAPRRGARHPAHPGGPGAAPRRGRHPQRRHRPAAGQGGPAPPAAQRRLHARHRAGDGG